MVERRHWVWTATSCLATALLWCAFQGVAAQAATLTCTPEKPVVETGATLRIRAWANVPNASALRFHWRVTGGRVVGRGREVSWNLSAVAPDLYTATVRLSGAGQLIECALDVIVSPKLETRGPERLSARAFLIRGRKEESDYGLYSYIVMPFPPSESQRARYVAVIKSCLELLESVTVMEEQYKIPRKQLNITYIPIERPLRKDIGKALERGEFDTVAQWVVRHYNYARGQVLYRAVADTGRGGPYLVSHRAPLTGKTKVAKEYVFQDLTPAKPALAHSWVREFLNQVAQEDISDRRMLVRLALNLRATVHTLAQGNIVVQNALDQLIEWRSRFAGTD